MACQAMQMWSFSGLVAAFLDLTIAYLLLCASAAAYLASKFLGFFGLKLPCPCDGMFLNVHSGSLCFNRLLVDFPIQILSDVQLSVRHKFPFANSISPKKYEYSAVGVDNCAKGVIELDGEASCSSSISDARGPADVVRREMSSKTGKIDMKGKGVFSHRPKSRLRHRKGSGSHGKNSSLFSYDFPVHEEVIDEQPYHHFSTNKRGSWSVGDGTLPVDNAGNLLEYDKAPKKMRGRLRTLSRDEINLSSEEDMCMKKSMRSSEELQDNPEGIQGCGGDEKNKIRLLEQTLERERAARAALYVELDKERSAAASAADEAMAMILRLQEEKASIGMEARQYQRIIEEKSAYDDEEMNILQEILVRREMEKYFLEKEVEAYRQMVSGANDQTDDYLDNNEDRLIFGSLNDPNHDPVLIQHQITASTDKEVTTENRCADDAFESKFNSKPAFGIESPFQSSFERLRDSNENAVHKSVSSGKMDLRKDIISEGKDMQMNQGAKIAEKVIKTCYGTEKGDPNYDPSLKQQTKDAPCEYRSSCDPSLDQGPQVYDVHIIGDGINLCSEATEDKREQVQVSSSLKVREIDFDKSGATRERINVITDSSSARCLDTEAVAKKSNLEVPRGLPPIARRGSSLSLRRSSMSAADTEMLKIDYEIVQLRERLKLVQEGREKLSFSLENRESKNVQLNILEDIARQIQEIRHLNEPQRNARQASLPLPNSKGLTKKRRSRSVSSSGFQMSSEG